MAIPRHIKYAAVVGTTLGIALALFKNRAELIGDLSEKRKKMYAGEDLEGKQYIQSKIDEFNKHGRK